MNKHMEKCSTLWNRRLGSKMHYTSVPEGISERVGNWCMRCSTWV